MTNPRKIRLAHAPKDSGTRQLTADPDRIAQLLSLQSDHFPLRPLALQPGDAVLFHCLTLHRSGPNASGRRRYALNITYNARDNLPPATTAAAAAAVTAAMPMPMPYAIVEDDAAVAAGGTAFDPVGWNVPFIPQGVHEALERWRDGEEVVNLGGGGAGGAVILVSEEGGEGGTVLAFDGGWQEAVEFKCRALKLRSRTRGVVQADAAGGGTAVVRVEVLPPSPPPWEQGGGNEG